MHVVFLIAACASILAVILICAFLFVNGIPTIGKIGLGNFVLGKIWMPKSGIFGIFPMIIGSIYVTAGAILVGVPVGILAAIYMAKFCNEKVYKIVKPAVDLLAGIPSVVYGFFGMVVLVPAFRNIFGNGNCVFTASILLGIMILPTIIGVSESAIRAVPDSYYEGSLGLGASHERSVFFAVLPAAKSGILAGIVLGIGRAIGETMAVVMVAGNQAIIPDGMFSGVRTLTSNIVLEMGYATDLHTQVEYGSDTYFLFRQALFSVGGLAAIFIFSMIDYHFYARYAGYFYLFSNLLLLVTKFIGHEVNGAKRWIKIGPIQFQSAEPAKLAIILFLSVLIVQFGKKLKGFKAPAVLFAFGALTFLLTWKFTENLSTAIIILGITCALIFVAHPKTAPFVLTAGIGLPVGIVGVRGYVSSLGA